MKYHVLVFHKDGTTETRQTEADNIPKTITITIERPPQQTTTESPPENVPQEVDVRMTRHIAGKRYLFAMLKQGFINLEEAEKAIIHARLPSIPG
ncbi:MULTISPECIES: hypothetical protein [Tatumella]|uniref:Uncharacterized protein n=1 Tax=Tatumella punctata TaxID=399969 RepID=A0ABW1VKL0_9GAMM|nr:MULTISPECIES: hypothetical protein [unclassified Tatumella]MBS0856542.1 hypothetical protein [Tatumella sp. JGM16]MBS0911542.1 hypothetical protein [Tatumella sp. JGM91]